MDLELGHEYTKPLPNPTPGAKNCVAEAVSDVIELALTLPALTNTNNAEILYL